MLLVAVALAGSVLVSRGVLLSRMDERIGRGLALQVAQLRRFAEQTVDPRTSAPFPDVRSLLQAYLERNIPDRSGTFAVKSERSESPPCGGWDTASNPADS
ncbi:hypothetical protein FraQA3DRAFT_2061 [Frankia sp. QA3]|nr:hypothetical protein [Frankia sp. QA3]EIV92490.1 hypothetical protein FraQA3DRAFT_2061 [Frankia sp. QA3]